MRFAYIATLLLSASAIQLEAHTRPSYRQNAEHVHAQCDRANATHTADGFVTKPEMHTCLRAMLGAQYTPAFERQADTVFDAHAGADHRLSVDEVEAIVNSMS